VALISEWKFILFIPPDPALSLLSTLLSFPLTTGKKLYLNNRLLVAPTPTPELKPTCPASETTPKLKAAEDSTRWF